MKNIPLCVDLDGTLIHTDTLVELFFRALKKNVLYIFLAPIWLLKGKANLKFMLSSRFSWNLNNVPFNEPLIEYLREQKNSGRALYLVTACEESLAKKLVSSLDLFTEVFGSSQTHNLVSSAKAKFLTDKFGEEGFDYIGNDWPDLKVWKHSKNILVANASKSLKSSVKKNFADKQITYFDKKNGGLKVILRAIRLHQWAKNLLIFVPIFLAHKYYNPTNILESICAFVCFGFCASSTYLINDLLDLETDRKHHHKKLRPLASGELSITSGALISASLMLVAFALCLFLPLEFFYVMLVYLVLTLLYSFKLKKMLLLDVLALACLYTIRIRAGGDAIESEISFWLLTFSVTIFLSLAFLKRFVDINSMDTSGKVSSAELIAGRAYQMCDKNLVAMLGVASGFTSLLLYIMFVNNEAMQRYEKPQVLIFGGMPLIYFISRMWILAGRGQVHSDPIIAAVKDKQSYILAIIMLVIFVLASPI